MRAREGKFEKEIAISWRWLEESPDALLMRINEIATESADPYMEVGAFCTRFRSALTTAAFEMRWHCDPESADRALAHFSAAEGAFGESISRCLAQPPPREPRIGLSTLLPPLLLFAIRNRWDVVSQIRSLVVHNSEEVIVELLGVDANSAISLGLSTIGCEPVSPRILGALSRSASKTHALSIYQKLILRAMENDSAGFTTLLGGLNDAFHSRAKIHAPPEFSGFGRVANAMAVDVYGIGVCKFALRAGVKVNIEDSVLLPWRWVNPDGAPS